MRRRRLVSQPLRTRLRWPGRPAPSRGEARKTAAEWRPGHGPGRPGPTWQAAARFHGAHREARCGTLVVSVALLLVVASVLGADPSPAPVRDWQRIVIHHSATTVGSAEVFGVHHRARGMINGLAYHFVIDNGRSGTRDGFIEVGDRWRQQLQGGHCRQPAVNETGIGICLVGDFTEDGPTARQLDSLVLLVRGLQEQFHIPDSRVTGHGEIPGEMSECPGRSFPWADLQRRSREARP